eukprot:GGOE01005993.1.p1 GENE.GGOE01005993.1~~GGOE01005993.1.p1  ORF type:complete len:836 (-),score=144.36 GGOE01005993.1:144-2279(-)
MDNSPESFCIRLYTLPKWEEYAARRSLFESLTSVLTTAYPGRSSRLMVFGSTVTTLTRGIEDCIHLSLPLDSSLVGESSHNRKAVQALREQEDLRPFLDPHVSNPFMVKLKAPLGGPVDCTLGVGTIGIQGSHWLRRYVLQSNIVRPLMVMVDNWERAWGAGISANQRGGRFDRHALQLMVLFFLCHEGLVPYLPPKHVDLATLPAFPEFISFADRTVPWPYVLQMLPHFFRFYAQWPADRVVALSEPPTVVVPREAKRWMAKPFGVEMPHRPSLNVAEFLTPKSWSELQAAFVAAAAIKDVRLLFRPPQPEMETGQRNALGATPTESAPLPAEHSAPNVPPPPGSPAPLVVQGPIVDTMPPVAPCNRQDAAHLRDLYMQQLLPSEEDHARRQSCFRDLQDRVAESGMELMMFGSTVTTLCTQGTDMDIAAIVKGAPPHSSDVKRLKLIRPALSSLKSIDLISGARIPILKKTDAPNGFPYNFDISCQSDGVVNSHWLRKYVVQYPIVRPLAMLVKEWSKAWDLNSGPKRRFNSYMLNLMLIYFLCHERIIDFIPPTPTNISTLAPFPPFVQFSEEGVHWEQVHALLRQFFIFFSQWPAGRMVCLSTSPLEGPMEAKSKRWHVSFAVEDPFIRSFNVARNIRPQTWAPLQARFGEAARSSPVELFTTRPLEVGQRPQRGRRASRKRVPNATQRTPSTPPGPFHNKQRGRGR